MWHFRVYAFGRAGTHILYEGDDAQTWMGDHAQAVRRAGLTKAATPHTLLRDTPAGFRLRHPHGPGAARPRRRPDHDDLHARPDATRQRNPKPSRWNLTPEGKPQASPRRSPATPGVGATRPVQPPSAPPAPGVSISPTA